MNITKRRWRGFANTLLGLGIANLFFLSFIRFFGEHNMFMTKVSIAIGAILILISGAIYFFAIRTSK